MEHPAKIARLPQPILEQLNQRLDGAQSGKSILAWVNALPEVQALLKAEFDGQPISSQNLAQWKQSSRFRNWKLLQAALQFNAEALPSQLDPAQLEKLSTNLIRALQLRFAALASKLPPPADDPQAELRLLAQLCQELSLLRRGDLSAERLALQRDHLALAQTKSQQELEELFWTWTKRPDIQAKLYPYRDPDKARRETVRFLDHHLLGVKTPLEPPEPDPDPACLI